MIIFVHVDSTYNDQNAAQVTFLEILSNFKINYNNYKKTILIINNTETEPQCNK